MKPCGPLAGASCEGGGVVSMLARAITSPRRRASPLAPPLRPSRIHGGVAGVLTAGNMEPIVETLVGRCPAGLAAVTSQGSDAVEGWCEQRDRSAAASLPVCRNKRIRFPCSLSSALEKGAHAHYLVGANCSPSVISSLADYPHDHPSSTAAALRLLLILPLLLLMLLILLLSEDEGPGKDSTLQCAP